MNKPVDSWWTVVAIDPIAIRLVPWLSRRSAVTPTRLTLTAFVLGLGAAVAFALDAHVVGAILYEIRFLFDCLDGKVARHRGETSEAGGFVDVACDMLVVGLCYATLTASVIDDSSWERFPLIIGVGLVTASAWAQTYRRLRYGEGSRESGPAPGEQPGWLQQRRLKSYPSSVEAETASLFLAPLLLGEGGIVVVLLVSYLFYLVSIADSFRRTYAHAAAGTP